MDMKKINILIVIILCVFGFSACEDPIDPILKDSDIYKTFVLYQPVYGNMTYELTDANAGLNMDALTCVQPNYGFTAAVTYTTQVSFANTFAAGTFLELPTTVNGEKVYINTLEMDKAMIGLYGGALPNPVVAKDVYIRLKAFISNATPSPLNDTLIVKPAYSNVIKLNIKPYVLPLFTYTEVTPRPWYIVGLDGIWKNEVAGLGSSLIPFGVVDGKKYNLNGDGEFTFTGYFKASAGFKFIRDVGAWAEQWGNSGGDGINNPHRKLTGDNDPSNFKVPADGYYTVKINSIENTATFVAATITPATYTSIGLIGAFTGNDWSSDVVRLTANESVNKHIWYTTYTFDGEHQCKLRANGSWDVNWGTAGGSDGNKLYSAAGIGVQGGKNFVQTAGTYIIILNDITGSYYFIRK
jgi:starch-binding outer membrane protein SusE/F